MKQSTTREQWSFFRALNPASSRSGITYRLAGDSPCQNEEMIDTLVSENIANAWHSRLDLKSALNATYDILMGEHYDLYLHGRNDCRGGAKGVLDYLIFPLVARKLIADFYLDSYITLSFTNILAWSIALPLELARFSAAVALTLLLAPVVALVHLLRGCFSGTIQAPGDEVHQSSLIKGDAAQEENTMHQTAQEPQQTNVRKLIPVMDFSCNRSMQERFPVNDTLPEELDGQENSPTL